MPYDKEELEKLVQGAKGRIISSTPAEEKPKAEAAKASAPAAEKAAAHGPSSFSFFSSASKAKPEEKKEPDSEFLTGDMIDSLFKDDDESGEA